MLSSEAGYYLQDSHKETNMSKKANPADAVEHWDIERLIPYARNSRTHSEAQIAQSKGHRSEELNKRKTK